MADAVHAILEFLHKHDFSVAENALRSELTAREKGNGPLPEALDEDFDMCVNKYLKAIQESHPAEPEMFRPEPSISLQSPERLKAPESGFDFIHGLQEGNGNLSFSEGPFSGIDKPGFPDSGLDSIELAKPLGTLKSTVLHTTALNMQQIGLKSRADSVEINASIHHDARYLAGAPQYLSVASPSKEQIDFLGEHKGDPVALSKYDEVAYAKGVQGGRELNFELVENDVISRGPWNAGNLNFEESRLVRSQHTEEDLGEQVGSPQWIGIVDQNDSGLELPVISDSQWRTNAEAEDWRLNRDILNGVDEDFAINHNDNSMLGRDLIASERGPKWNVLAGDTERLYHQDSSGMAPVSMSKDNDVLEKAGFTRNYVSSSAWKDVPIKTAFPLPTPEFFSPLPHAVEPYNVNEVSRGSSKEDKTRLESMKASEAEVERNDKSSRERASSADGGGVKVLEAVSRTFHDAQEEMPRLPPVRLRSGDSKTTDTSKDSILGSNSKRHPDSAVFLKPGASTEAAFGLGSFLDIPIGQDVSSSGTRRLSGGSRPSVSQGIVEDASERLSGFATVGDGQSESLVEYPDEFWDSDTYDDDDDPGYHRQPIEDEEWFLAHEIEYPDERSSPGLESSRSHHDKDYGKYEDDDRSVLEEESYFSGEEYYRSKRAERREAQNEIERLGESDLYRRVEESQNGALRRQAASQLLGSNDYDGQHLDADDFSMVRGQPDWQGFSAQESGLVEGRDKVVNERSREDVGSVRSGGGAGISSEVAEFGSEVRGSNVDGSSDGDLESLKDREMGGYGSMHSSREIRKDEFPSNRYNDLEGSQEVTKDTSLRNSDGQEVDHEMILRYYNDAWSRSRPNTERQITERMFEQEKGGGKGNNGIAEINFPQEQELGGFGFGGFSFPSPSSAGEVAVMSRADSGKSLWSVRDIVTPRKGDEGDDYANGVVGPDDTLAVWKRKSNESSPIISPRNETLPNLTLSTDSTISARSTDGYVSGEVKGEDEEVERTDINKEEADAVAADDEEAAAVQEQIRRIRAEEEEFETFNLKIVHRKNRTGFEEDKDFPVVINSVIAGRYHVTEYLGSAAFSKAIQAHDLHTGMDVCMKIIKNNKDFFDQSLDEIKLLKYINKHDPGDKYHVLRLYDYFYHREHLFIVCELLRANLYEFHKYNRESGGEVYFTMPRLQSITRQCLEALEFIHGLKLIHCDLKPENILVKSYSRCEVKVIDLGSSCFQTDHLCSYVQSRSYRAPEVILGLPYNQKIDMWSLGCILAELCSGNVLFQNDSLATLMARVVGILGPIDPEMLAKGRDTYKFFTKNHMLYERNQDSEQLEYLLPKKTSLAHRLPMGDQGFVDFVGYLLQINPATRPTATDALKHTWLSYPYEPISA